MRVCQVLAGDEDGGLETHVLTLSNALAAAGDSVAVVAHPRYAANLHAPVAFHGVDLSRSRRNPFLRRDLRRAIAATGADIVHAHAGKAAALVAALDLETPVVGTVHGTKRNLADYAGFTRVIGVSAGVIESLDHPGKSVVYPGVADAAGATMTRETLARELAIDPLPPLCLAVGRLEPVKAFHRLVAFWNEDLGNLVLVGEGTERRRLERLAAGKPVVLTGFREDVRALMGVADLLVISSAREAFHLGMAEALRARLPVVSTPVHGPDEVLPPEQLAEANALEAAIRRCLADPETTRRRLSGTFDWAARTLTVERMVRDTRNVYAAALGS